MRIHQGPARNDTSLDTVAYRAQAQLMPSSHCTRCRGRDREAPRKRLSNRWARSCSIVGIMDICSRTRLNPAHSLDDRNEAHLFEEHIERRYLARRCRVSQEHHDQTLAGLGEMLSGLLTGERRWLARRDVRARRPHAVADRHTTNVKRRGWLWTRGGADFEAEWRQRDNAAR